MRTNKYILSGYRINHRTYSDAIWSLFTVHNESVNVWSHFLGAKLFIAIIIYLSCFKQATLWNPLQRFADVFYYQANSAKEGTLIDTNVSTCKSAIKSRMIRTGPLYLHAFCALSMMTFSAWYHLNSCQSEQKMYYWRKFDLVGIVLQLMGSQAPPFFYVFYCEEDQYLFRRYVGFSWAICIGAGATVLMPSGLRGKSKHYLCALAFLLAGWSTSPGCIHMAFYRNPQTMIESQFGLWLAGGLLYSVGAIIYALKFPEVCGKGCFDIVGSSH